jgi:uncharacterized lipoprotein YddW (UPF0748 family)
MAHRVFVFSVLALFLFSAWFPGPRFPIYGAVAGGAGNLQLSRSDSRDRGVALFAPSPHDTGQLRAFWVDAFHDGIKTPAQIDQLIADAHTANANALIVQVRRRGDSYYNESVEPRADDSGLDPESFDPLAYLIEAAHGADPPLQVHAWVVVFPVWSPGYSTTDPERHVYYRHGCGNGCSWDDPENWMTYRYNGGDPQPEYQLDPGHPDAARYTIDVCLYLVRHYDIDGLHFDYVRYNGQEYGYNKVSEDRFHAAYGGSGHPDPADENWKQWRREQVTGVVRQVYLETLAVKPDLVLSAATIAWGDGPHQTGGWETTSAYRSVFQDWRNWLQEGILDLAIPMNYDREHEADESEWFANWIEWEKDHQFDRRIAAGPGPFLNYISGSLSQAHKAMAPSDHGNSLLGLSFYSYASTNIEGLPNSTFYQALSSPSPYGTPPFPTWVDAPTLSWKTDPTLGHLAGWAIGPDGPLDRVAVTITGPETINTITNGDGFFGAVDISPGAYTITLPAPASSPLYATVEAGQVALATIDPPAADPALRILLVDAAHDGIKNPDQVDVLLADARAAHVNTLVVQVRSYGQRYYESTLEPRADDPELAPNFDPLAYLIEQAHEEPAMEVYAWVPALAIWDQGTPPANPEHLFNQHPEWLSEDVNGNQLSSGEYFLDPGHPGVLTYTVELALDLVSRYSLDGLFLDRLRYGAEGATVGYPTWGYNATAVQRFHDRYGGSGDPTPDDPLWMAWRREQLSNLLRQIYLRCTEASPSLRIAVAGVAWGNSPLDGGWEQSSAYGRVLQDWRGWLEEGIVDLTAPMNYDREYNADQRGWYDDWISWEAGQTYNRGIVVLQGSYLNYPEHTLDQAGDGLGADRGVGFASYIPANLYADPDGNSLWIQPPRQPWYYSPESEWWLWRSLALPYGYSDPATGLFTSTAPLFPGLVSTPTLAWKDVPTRGHAVGLALGLGGGPLDGVTVTLSGPAARILHSDASGFFGTVDLPPGTCLAEVTGGDPIYPHLYVDVEVGKVAWFEPCPERVTVQGPLALLVGQTGTYHAYPEPITASLPITYTWDNGTIGPTAAYSWTLPGTHTLFVTATNLCGQQQGTMSVRVLTEWPHWTYLPLIFR